MDNEQRIKELEAALKHFKQPFQYAEDSGSYILDSDGNIVLEVRGWGCLSHILSDSEAIQTQENIAKAVVNLLNSTTEADKITNNPLLGEQVIYVPVSVKDKIKPSIGDEVLVSYDGGVTFPEEAAYLDSRTCMLAGVGGGNGYFGEGFATNGSTGCEKGLILPDVTHWLRQTTLSEYIKELHP
jgi:hypothetical protein